MWSLERGITLQVQYLPGEENVKADRESWVMRDRSDSMLNPEIFKRVLRRFSDLEINMFASRLSFQLPRFFSWRSDPLSGSNRCFPPRMERGESIYKTPVKPDRESPDKGGAANSGSDTYSPSVAVTAIWCPRLLNMLIAVPLRIRM